jgi:hypothetical protein
MAKFHQLATGTRVSLAVPVPRQPPHQRNIPVAIVLKEETEN